jgi:hypothetical protein
MPIAPTTAVPLADVQNICTFLGLDPADVTDFAAFDKAVQPFCYRGDGNGRLPEHTDLDDLLKTLNSSLSNISGWQGIASSAKAGGQSAVQKRKCLARVHFAPLTGDAVQNLSDAERHEETTWRGSKAGTSGPVGRKKKAVRTAISKFYPDIKFAEDGSVIQPPSVPHQGSPHPRPPPPSLRRSESLAHGETQRDPPADENGYAETNGYRQGPAHVPTLSDIRIHKARTRYRSHRKRSIRRDH